MKATQRQKYLAIVEEKVKTEPGFTICKLCHYMGEEWDGDDYRSWKYPVCYHPLPVLKDSENMPIYLQQDGHVEDCWGFRPKKKNLVNFDALQTEIGEWANKTFNRSGTEADFAAVFTHLEREVAELKTTHFAEEAADVALCLLHICHMAGIPLYRAIREKFALNQTRKWGEPDEFGVIEHIEGA